MSDPSRPEPTLGELVGRLGGDLSTLFRQEVELAKTEIRAEATKAGKAAGMFGGAGVAGWMAAIFLSLALVWALDAVLDAGWAALIVAVLWGAAAAGMYAKARRQAQEINPVPEKTVQTLREDAQWIRDRTS
ncbi:phage holin family protein [Herbidospora sp. NEAU-GS84]|uniref:Phage holin family protein n=1 Tax=Herbidospora solisilvae TaxID=2696284 RepID=A0A7C9MZI5_9ACTN|nr:phage holin family protein [Herbidospora solisilvae]NAS22110.1 phage holin family protein [Herbidospora solisilvae]